MKGKTLQVGTITNIVGKKQTVQETMKKLAVKAWLREKEDASKKKCQRGGSEGRNTITTNCGRSGGESRGERRGYNKGNNGEERTRYTRGHKH